MFIVNFDEWGGFFEHVAPPRATAGNQVDTDIVDGKTLLGFRVPTVIASPFAKGGPSNPQVNHLVFDHTSVLKLIEWRWRLMPLTPRDASNDINNLAYAMNLAQSDPSVPTLPAPQAPLVAAPCLQNLFGGFLSSGGSPPATTWQQLGQVAANAGYLVRP